MRYFWAPVHHSWCLVCLMAGVVAGAILAGIFPVRIYPALVLAAVSMAVFSCIFRFRWSLILAFVAGVVFVYVRSNYAPLVVDVPGIKDAFSRSMREVIPDSEVGLALGYLLGVKDKIPSLLFEEIRTVGLAHIVVVSGTHLGIVVNAAKKLFGRISRAATVFCGCAATLGYLYVIGFMPSILRASLVTILSLFFWYFGRRFKPWRIILLTMGMTLLFDNTLISSLSWQLSFGAFVGVLAITPRLIKFFYGNKKPNGIMSIVFASIGASVMCLPIQVFYFGSLSLVAVLANILILPTIPLVMGLSFLAGMLNFVVSGLASMVGQTVDLLLKYHVFVIDSLSQNQALILEFKNNQPVVFLVYVPVAILLIWSSISERKAIYCRDKTECRSKRLLHHQRE